MKRVKEILKGNKGFTLIELVCVVVIIGILLLLIVPKVAGAKDSAKIAADRSSIKTINNCIALHCAVNSAESLEGRTSMNVPRPIKDGDSVTVILQYLADKGLVAEGTQIFHPIGHSYDATENMIN